MSSCTKSTLEFWTRFHLEIDGPLAIPAVAPIFKESSEATSNRFLVYTWLTSNGYVASSLNQSLQLWYITQLAPRPCLNSPEKKEDALHPCAPSAVWRVCVASDISVISAAVHAWPAALGAVPVPAAGGDSDSSMSLRVRRTAFSGMNIFLTKNICLTEAGV